MSSKFNSTMLQSQTRIIMLILNWHVINGEEVFPISEAIVTRCSEIVLGLSSGLIAGMGGIFNRVFIVRNYRIY